MVTEVRENCIRFLTIICVYEEIFLFNESWLWLHLTLPDFYEESKVLLWANIWHITFASANTNSPTYQSPILHHFLEYNLRERHWNSCFVSTRTVREDTPSACILTLLLHTVAVKSQAICDDLRSDWLCAFVRACVRAQIRLIYGIWCRGTCLHTLRLSSWA